MEDAILVHEDEKEENQSKVNMARKKRTGERG